jgi:hypothetical protein
MIEAYQIKITIQKDKIWRRARILSDFTFWDLHIVIRDLMEWGGGLYHYFKITTGSKVSFIDSFPCMGDEPNENPLSWNVLIGDFLPKEKTQIEYFYYGADEFICVITLEKILKVKPKIQYPIYTGGNKICPDDIEHPASIYTRYVFGADYVHKFDPDKVLFTGTSRALWAHKCYLLDSIFKSGEKVKGHFPYHFVAV